MADRDSLIQKAKLCEQTERYEAMAACMNEVAKMDEPLNTEERNLLSVGYKNIIGAKRSSWRVITSIEQKSSDNKAELAKEFRQEIEGELRNACNELLELLDTHLVQKSIDQYNEDQSASSAETALFYLKMKGDYFRYLAEVEEDDRKAEQVDNALKAYKTAQAMCENLKATNPVRLGFSLNYAVFYYELVALPDQACEIAKKAFDEAIAELDSLPEDSYKASTLIMQLLRDNLTLWTEDV